MIDAYDVRVALRKSSDGEKTTRVYIRPSKRGKTLKQDFPWPKGLDERDLNFENMGKDGMTASYHRKGNLDYYDSTSQKIPMDLAQRLELLVIRTLEK